FSYLHYTLPALGATTSCQYASILTGILDEHSLPDGKGPPRAEVWGMARQKDDKASKKLAKGKGIEREIASNVLDIVELEHIQRGKRTVGERLSEVIAKFCGSMTFVYVHIVWFGAWVVFND